MRISDPTEVESVLSFFRTHLGRELNLTISMFEGLMQYERVTVQDFATVMGDQMEAAGWTKDSHGSDLCPKCSPRRPLGR